MNLLAFDTSTDTVSIAVQAGDAVWQHTGPGGSQASATLIPAIRSLLAQAGMSFSTLDAIVFGRGPGSFTGLRTACAVAQGLAFGARGGAGVPVLSVTFGRVQDFAVHDINNMGAAMMPAAASTLLRYFSATGTSPQDFDAIFTGDLGEVGTALLHEQMAKEGLPLDNHKDCGCLLYDTNSQNVQAGGSGAGCGAGRQGRLVAMYQACKQRCTKNQH